MPPPFASALHSGDVPSLPGEDERCCARGPCPVFPRRPPTFRCCCPPTPPALSLSPSLLHFLFPPFLFSGSVVVDFPTNLHFGSCPAPDLCCRGGCKNGQKKRAKCGPNLGWPAQVRDSHKFVPWNITNNTNSDGFLNHNDLQYNHR